MYRGIERSKNSCTPQMLMLLTPLSIYVTMEFIYVPTRADLANLSKQIHIPIL